MNQSAMSSFHRIHAAIALCLAAVAFSSCFQEKTRDSRGDPAHPTTDSSDASLRSDNQAGQSITEMRGGGSGYFTGIMPVDPASAEMQGYIATIEEHMRKCVNDVLLIREKQETAGNYGVSPEELKRKDSFAEQVENYIATINNSGSLESLCRYWWHSPEPDDMPLSLWSDAMDTTLWLLCEKIARFGTPEAYETLTRLRNDFSDGAACGHFRFLEWKYLRQYSQDPVVRKSKTGIFH